MNKFFNLFKSKKSQTEEEKNQHHVTLSQESKQKKARTKQTRPASDQAVELNEANTYSSKQLKEILNLCQFDGDVTA